MEDSKHIKEKQREEKIDPHAAEIAELKKISEEYKDTMQRLQAEFENFKKRNERENEEFRKFVHGKTLEEFLPIVDSLYEGINQAGRKKNEEMKKGFEFVLKQLLQILDRNGVRKIETEGKKFDHNLHEVLMTSKDESKGDEIVLEELQRGYMINGKVLRPAKVKVNKRD